MMYRQETQQIVSNFDHGLYSKLANNSAFLAGGALTSIFSGRTVNDFDLYFRSNTGRENVSTYLNTSSDYDKVVESPNALTYQSDNQTLQLVKLNEFIGTPEEILNKFDFTINQAAFDFETKEFLLGDRFLQDLAKQRLKFNKNTPYPINSLIRLEKYINRGFKINAIEGAKLGLSIREIKINTLGELKEHLRGVDLTLLQNFFDDLNGGRKQSKQ